MIKIRAACGGDAQRILEIAEEAISPSWTYAYVQSRLGRDDTLVFVAEEHGADAGGGQQASSLVTGFAVFRTVGDDIELLQIAVDIAYRHCGTGSLLLGAGIEIARNNAPASVFLEVRASNGAAIALYEKHGFTPVRVRKDYYDSPAEDALVMSLHV